MWKGERCPPSGYCCKRIQLIGKNCGYETGKAPIHGTGNVVVMDSGFCVLQAIVELRKAGVFSSAMIKKRRYWPRYVKGEQIKEHFAGKEAGAFDAMKGKLQNTDFYIYGMKEPDYVLLFMTTYGREGRQGKEQSQTVEDGGVMRRVK